MSKMSELHDALSSAKILEVVVHHAPPSPTTVITYSGREYLSAFDTFRMAERRYQNNEVQIRDGFGRVLIGRVPVPEPAPLPEWELERLDRECARLS